jgi:hypothetical protein
MRRVKPTVDGPPLVEAHPMGSWLLYMLALLLALVQLLVSTGVIPG